ncbi:uncharacterized protein At5g39865 [Diospyros lotus]|uniref:uncharacterized protein At5g39865 n=1 Tax=Diospyros lotus TaxID=55363 RepID=UPI002257D2E0|nr:uncharacterized protein At5g39865 [Diospyros lotus]
MKGMKGRFLKKIRSFSTLSALKQGIVFQVNTSNQSFPTSALDNDQADENGYPKEFFPGSISVPKVGNQVKDEAIDSALHGCNRETKDHSQIPITLEFGSTNAHTVPLPSVQLFEEPESCHSQPNQLLNTELQSPEQGNDNFEEFFDPEPLVPFEPMGMEHESVNEDEEENEESSPLLDFEEKCPPGGSQAIILYTTSLRGIRKTFEDCSSIRFLLESFHVVFYERDVSMHLEFREELWKILGGRVVPPRLFIKGRDIGGADEVVGLHEQGRLRKLFHGIPQRPSNNPCSGCGGMRFVVCLSCHGSCKVNPQDLANEFPIRCSVCNENGLTECPICC